MLWMVKKSFHEALEGVSVIYTYWPKFKLFLVYGGSKLSKFGWILLIFVSFFSGISRSSAFMFSSLVC